MYVLLWLMLKAGGGVDHFQVGAFQTREECEQVLHDAKVLVKNQNSKVVCLEIAR